MPEYTVERGATEHIMSIVMRSSTDGQPKATLAYGSVTCQRFYDGDTSGDPISLVDGTVGTFVSESWKEVDATNAVGVFQFCPATAAVNHSGKATTYTFKGTGFLTTVLKIKLDPVPSDVVKIDQQAVSAAAAMTFYAYIGVPGATGEENGPWVLGPAGAYPTIPASGDWTTVSDLSGLSTYDGKDTSGVTTLLGLTNHTTALDPLSVKVNNVAAYWGTVAFPTNWAALATTLSSAYDAAKTAAPTAETNAAAVWDLTTTGHTTAGTWGGLLSGIAEVTSAFQLIEIPDSGGLYAPVVVAKYRDSALTLTATYLDAKVSEVGGGTAPTVEQIAAGILLTPANKLASDDKGRVTTANPASEGGTTVNMTVETTEISA